MEKDSALRKLRIVIPNKENRMKRFLKRETGWDGKCPIPFTYLGGCHLSEISELNILDFSGDGCIIWVKDIVSAAKLFKLGHNLVTDSAILAKRATIAGIENLNNKKECGRVSTVAFFN